MLKEQYPFPNVSELSPFVFELDGGGRDLIEDVIVSLDRPILMAEVGCFLCGSTLRWLKAKNDVFVVGIDPWEGDFAGKLEKYKTVSWADYAFKKVPERDKLIKNVVEYGPEV